MMDNNSGHYQPTDRHFNTLVEYIMFEGAFHEDAKVGSFNIREHGRAGVQFEGSSYARMGMAPFAYNLKADNRGHTAFPRTQGASPRSFNAINPH
jgi:hypothetical protein